MQIKTIKTEKILPLKHNIFSLLDKYLVKMPERSILAIASKIIAMCEGNVIKKGAEQKDDIAKREADYYLPDKLNNYGYMLTIKDNILTPVAGIDESNGNGDYILWPHDPQKSANDILDYLKKRFGRKEIGVIITDSKTTPLRWGTTGVAIAHSGFVPLRDYVGTPDIFGTKLRVTKSNIMDALAASAVLLMGEGSEQTPLALIDDLPFIVWQDRHPTNKELEDLKISIGDDLYAEILQSVEWQTKKP